MKKLILLLILVLTLSILLYGCGKTEYKTVPENTYQEQSQDSAEVSETAQAINEKNYVEITPNGFNPQVLTINAGEIVTWKNAYALPSRPASNIHPTHTLYPESGGCISSKFDACRNLKQGETYAFTFNEKGEWRYHDHLDPGKEGIIIIK